MRTPIQEGSQPLAALAEQGVAMENSVQPFKPHFVWEESRGPISFLSPHHHMGSWPTLGEGHHRLNSLNCSSKQTFRLRDVH